MGATSEHFSDKELACKHCGLNGCTSQLVAALEAFRAIAGKPVLVNDAYRCLEHNKSVGGVPDSAHVRGEAADIRVEGLKARDLETIARQIRFINGIGRSDRDGYIHIDVRGIPAEWCYGDTGQQCGYYP